GASTSEAATPVKPAASARTARSTASVGCRCSSAAAKPICTMPGSLLAETLVTGGKARGTLGITMTTPAPPPVPAAASAPELDVLLTRTVVFDLIFRGFPHPPTPRP